MLYAQFGDRTKTLLEYALSNARYSTYEQHQNSQPATSFLPSCSPLGWLETALAVCVRLVASSNDGGFS
jgi:hypothetical protein